MSRNGNKNSTSSDVMEGHYLVGNEGIYKVWEFLGEGTFGKVAKCTKMGSQELCAIKIMKNDQAGQKELKSMQLLKDLDTEEDHVIKMYESFTFQNRTCMVYEILAESFHNVWQMTHLCYIRAIAQNLLKALKALKRIGLAHCDIKTDNIMFVDKSSMNVKLIDFGLALETKELSNRTKIQVTPFRAPEVILGLPLDEGVDMWALGMVLACAYFGYYPFPHGTEYDTIRAMVQIFGSPEAEVLHKAKNTRTFFTWDDGCSDPTWRLQTPEEHEDITGNHVDDVNHVIDLDAMIKVHRKKFPISDDDDHRVFIDLLKRMLEVNPQNRITPSQALTHDFITMKHLAGENKATYAATAESIIGKNQPSNPKPAVSSSASQTSDGSLKTSVSDISSSGSYGSTPKTSVSDGSMANDTDVSEVASAGSVDEQSTHSSLNSSSSGSYSLTPKTSVSDGSMANDTDVSEVASAGSVDEQSTHSSLNSSSCDSIEKSMSQQNSEKTEDLKTDGDQEKKSSGKDKENNSFGVKAGQLLVGDLGTYEVGDLLGKGAFGKVFKCCKVGSEEHFAIKILTDVNEGKEEFEAMQLIKDLDPDKNNLMKFYECFSFRNEICLVYEILDQSLQHCLEDENTSYLCQIRAVAQQMFHALNALKSIGVVHGDIKTDNILFAKEESLRIKLIDFGFARKAKGLLTGTEIQVTPFRAPEVILGLPLDESIDMWALGVVLACLYNGDYPFPYETEYETIRAMVQIFGLPEEELLIAGDFTDSFFTRDDDGWRLLTPDEYTQDTGEQLGDENHVVDLHAMTDVHQDVFLDHDDDDHRVFIDLLKRMLDVNPQNRITPSQALAHDFITMKHLAGDNKATYATVAEYIMGTVQFQEKKKKKEKKKKTVREEHGL